MKEIKAVIPARAGSKRLKGKNKRLFCGKPLFCWTIDLALEIKEIDEIIITTDDEDILMYCYENYNDFDRIQIKRRAKKFAKDCTPTWKVLEDLYHSDLVDKDSVILLLQVTSPLRTKEDLEMAINMYKENDKGVVSVYKIDQKTYIRDGSVFVDSYENWIKNGTADGQYFLIDKERAIDIDNEQDFELAQKIMSKRLTKEIMEDINEKNSR